MCPKCSKAQNAFFLSCLSIVLEYFIYDPPNPIQVIKLLTGCLEHQQAWEGAASLLWTLASPVSGPRLCLWRVRGAAGALGEGDNLSIYCLKVPQKGRLAPTSPSTPFPFFLFVLLSIMSWVPNEFSFIVLFSFFFQNTRFSRRTNKLRYKHHNGWYIHQPLHRKRGPGSSREDGARGGVSPKRECRTTGSQKAWDLHLLFTALGSSSFRLKV